MPYVWDTHKGLVFTAEKPKALAHNIVSDGIGQLDLAPHLSEYALAASEYSEPNTPQSRKEKRQAKKAVKAAVKAAKRDNRTLVKRHPTDESPGPQHQAVDSVYNPDQALKELINLYRRISNDAPGSDSKLFQFKLIAFYKSDASHLVPKEWLNDNDISFVYELVSELILKPSGFGHHIHLLYPSVVQLWTHYPMEEDLKNLLPMDDLRKLKLVFIPFNFMEDCDYVDLEDANNGDHWALCVLSVSEKKLLVYDSMAFDTDQEGDTLLKKLASRISTILFKSPTKVQVLKMTCDQQKNFDDCGVFLIMITGFLISKLLSGEPSDLDVSKVKFEPMSGRLQVMRLAYRYFMANS